MCSTRRCRRSSTSATPMSRRRAPPARRGRLQRRHRPLARLRRRRRGVRRRRPRGRGGVRLPPLLVDADRDLRRDRQLGARRHRRSPHRVVQLPRPVHDAAGDRRRARALARPGTPDRARGHRRLVRDQVRRVRLRRADGPRLPGGGRAGALDRGSGRAPARQLGGQRSRDDLRRRGRRRRARARPPRRPDRQRRRLPAPARAGHPVSLLRQPDRRLRDRRRRAALAGGRHQQGAHRTEPRLRRPAAVLRARAPDGQDRRPPRTSIPRSCGGAT